MLISPTLFDTHAHLDQPDFDPDRREVIDRAEQAGVAAIVAVGTTRASSETCVGLAAEFPGIYAAVGIHPNHAAEVAPGDWDRIVELLARPKVVALGETGLDRHWDFAPLDVQKDYFDRHLRLSQERNVPFIVHVRESETEVLEMLREAHQRGPLRGVMHAFSGDEEMAAECVAMGLHISFAGRVTFKKSVALRAVAATVPDERLLVETDSPYLSPHPVRSQRRNEPANVRHTAACLAEARKQSVETIATQTTANARQLFGLK